MGADNQRAMLEQIARQAMITYGLDPDWPSAADAELRHLSSTDTHDLRDLRSLPWSSIDNDESRDLDQVEVTVEQDGRIRLLIALADVEHLVRRDSALDVHARANTTSVYTPVHVFPMLPPRLSTDLSSLNPDEDRDAIVVDLTADSDGVVRASSIYPARVRNHAKLTYRAVAAWLEGRGPLPATALGPDLERQITTQDAIAARLREHSHEEGALDFARIELKPVVDEGGVRAVETEAPNRARNMIESFMIAANGATARFLSERGYASIRRIVRSPARWSRIVKVAAEHGGQLPAEPDARALAGFLKAQRAASPVTFAELSLAVIKLLGGGEYVAEGPRSEGAHFALAVTNYTHSTAPNRRYPNLVTQRIVKAAVASAPAPYSLEELTGLAAHCTHQEDAAAKVERLVRKAAAALWLAPRIGEEFDAVVTGASPKGTWVRLCEPPIEGRVERGFQGLDVGDAVRVKLVHVQPERGFIDFAFLARRPATSRRC